LRYRGRTPTFVVLDAASRRMIIKSKPKDAAWPDSEIGHTEGLITVQYIANHGLRLRLVPCDAVNVMAS
jgi:hypothetical protein